MTITITSENKQYILVGTAHVSQKSVEEMEEAIATHSPDTICVELDQRRYANLAEQKTWEKMDIIRVIKERKAMLLFSTLVLASFQQRVGSGMQPGREMIRAIEIAKEKGIPFRLCDREVDITLLRAWRRSGFWAKNKILALLTGALFSSKKMSAEEIEQIKTRNEVDRMMSELSEYLPSIRSVLIEERDAFLAQKISEAPGTKVLAVIGMGHIQGVVQALQNKTADKPVADTDELRKIPAASKLGKLAKWILPLGVVGLILSGFFAAQWQGVWDNFLRWIFINGSLAAFGAILALAHPLTILLSFAMAPLTSLNPTIGVGFVAGLIEGGIRKPRIVDFSHLNTDVKTIRGFYHNRITRVLLVFILASLGSSVGTFVAIPLLFPSLG